MNYHRISTNIQWTSRSVSGREEPTGQAHAHRTPSFNEDISARFSVSGMFVDFEKYRKIAEEIRRRIISAFETWKEPAPGLAYDPGKPKPAPDGWGGSVPAAEKPPELEKEPPVEEVPKAQPVAEPKEGGRTKHVVYLNFRDDAFDNLGLSEEKKLEAKDRAIEKVKEEYQDYNVVVVTEPPKEGEFTTIVIGGTSPKEGALGLAEYDPGNKDLSNMGYVYTQELPKGHAALDSVEEVGDAVGNIITHELGHTLGLDDHQDPRDKEIMDGQMKISSLPWDKYFTPANQELLEENVGFDQVA
ncbi:MAG: hypothetical protein AB1797_12290 [bacterium]